MFLSLRAVCVICILLLGSTRQALCNGSVYGTTVDNDRHGLSFEFPTLEETVELARLSKLVYRFKWKDSSYCASYKDEGRQCHYYYHDVGLGTQVLIVSSSIKRYIAVVFAGTDDLRTSLEDIDIAKKQFGNNSTVKLKDPDVKVHAGFNNAVFRGVFDEIVDQLKIVRKKHPLYKKLYTTGHSLGAANSILTATGLALEGEKVVSINFGCPQTGNHEWREFLGQRSKLDERLGIWKVVLGWDLVPRLPDFFEHVGHTIQLWSEDHQKYDKHSPDLVECYFKHYGDIYLGYAGIPSGWSSKPYAWLPGALMYHPIDKYVEFLEDLQEKNLWVDAFKALEPIGYDDDIYDDPPDDWYALDEDYNSHTQGLVE